MYRGRRVANEMFHIVTTYNLLPLSEKLRHKNIIYTLYKIQIQIRDSESK